LFTHSVFPADLCILINRPDEFADQSQEEFFEARGSCFTAAVGASAGGVPVKPNVEAPSSTATVAVDWRDASKNAPGVVAVTPVKNQGAFGTCWSFGASGCLEGMQVIQQQVGFLCIVCTRAFLF
jgi:C1A family cysteine protease